MEKMIKPKKQHKKGSSPIKKIIILSVLSLILIGGVAVGIVGYDILNDIYGYKNSNINKQIEIPQGANTITIANILKREGIIKYTRFFRSFSRDNQFDGKYKPGLHTLDKVSGYRNIINVLILEGEGLTSITFPEGFTQADIVARLSKAGYGTEKEILSVIDNVDISKYPFLANIPKRESLLEGYIFPDTYTHISPKDTAADIIDRALKNFAAKIQKNDIEQKARAVGLTLDDVITLSTIIQMEVADVKNMKKVSAVFHNRLKAGMKLQSDVTVSYALNGKKSITIADTKTESPYNTYYVDALPKGPICNPGIDAIIAAVEPDTDYMAEKYLYFYSRPNKEVFYAKTFAEHTVIANKYRNEWKGIVK